jgi:hypothetical protein
MTYVNVQIRSVDEGSTLFYTCTKCGHKFTLYVLAFDDRRDANPVTNLDATLFLYQEQLDKSFYDAAPCRLHLYTTQ